MKIGNSFWVVTYEDVHELERMVENGTRLPSGLEFSHTVKDNGKEYFCFRPTDRRVDGCLYVGRYDMAKVFKILDATVTTQIDGHSLTFDGRSMIIDHCKTIKYKYEGDTVYHLQKTQYKGSNPYGFLSMAVDGFWKYRVIDAIHSIGYVA